MSKNNSIPIRSDPELKKLLQDVKLEKIKLGKNRELLSDRRLTLAITRIPDLKRKLIDWDIKDEK